MNNEINRIHEGALRIACRDYQSNFNVLLENDCSVSMHVKNLQTLMIEMFKRKAKTPFYEGDLLREFCPLQHEKQ